MPKSNVKVLGAFLLTAATINSIAAANPLFESDETLSVVFELPIKEVLRHAKERPTVPGLLRYTDSEGAEVVLDVEFRTRGKSRLAQCSYPPLRLKLKKKQVEVTLFAGQNKLKLVTQCRRTSSSLRYLEQEYLIYRTYNLLSPYSFRVRKLAITFRDSTGKRKDEVHPGFFIESTGEVATRLGMTRVKTDTVEIYQLDPGQAAVFALFQYMIGNTDWSARKGPGTDGCCHNGKLLAPPDSDTGWVVLPYDFDQAGLINTSYAAPSEKLPIKTVRQRLYRGFCSGNDELDQVIALFNDQRAAIEDLFSGGTDGSSGHKSALKYLQGFYKIINDPKQRERKIVDACRGPKT